MEENEKKTHTENKEDYKLARNGDRKVIRNEEQKHEEGIIDIVESNISFTTDAQTRN